MQNLKHTLLALLVAFTGLGLTGCTDSEIAFGAGVIVGVIIDDDHHHHHYRYPPRRRPNPPRYYGRYAEINLSQLQPSERVAVKYDLSISQAQKLTSELLKVREGDLSGLRTLGFEVSDLKKMMQGNNPSAATLEKLALSLDMDIAQAHDLIQNIKVDVAEAQERML